MPAENELADSLRAQTPETPAETAETAETPTSPEKTPASPEQTPASPEQTDVPMEDTDVPPTADQAQDQSEPEPVDLEKVRAEFQEKAKTYLIEQSRHVVIPSFAKWFDMNEINQIEKNLFPDFFPKKTQEEAPVSVYKSPETYQNIRDFIINTYRINPVEYLTVTAVRRNLTGDVASIIRIHRFLETWGLINYQIDPRTKPSLVGPQYTGHFQITLDTPKGLTPLVPEETPLKESTLPVADFHDSDATAVNSAVDETSVKTEAPDAIPINMEVTRNIFAESKSKAATSVSYFCNETSADITDVRYHNLKSKSQNGGPQIISKACFDQGLFPQNFTASDFVKLQKEDHSGEWSQQEVLLLLEGIEMYATVESEPQSFFVNSNGQWDKISEHIGTKNREECLTKFLQMPIEDKYLQKVKKEGPMETLSEGLNKDTIIQEVINRLVSTKQGEDILTENSKKRLEETLLNQTNLISQAIELTLEKFDTKLQRIDHLESELIKAEKLLSLQRKQVLLERWANYEKIIKFKKEKIITGVDDLLDDLLTPLTLEQLDGLDLETPGASNVSNAVDAVKQAEILPVSVVEPKSYLFWSA